MLPKPRLLLAKSRELPELLELPELSEQRERKVPLVSALSDWITIILQHPVILTALIVSITMCSTKSFPASPSECANQVS
jgi:hypothetical protein